MSESVPSVSSAEVGFASGILGAGVGYILAPRKYNLEQLLTQPHDTFEKSVSKTALAKMDDKAKKAYNLITDARNKYLKAVENNSGEAKLVELTRAPSLESAYKNIKKAIPKAKTESAVIAGAIMGFVAMVVNYVTSPRS